MDNDGHLIQQAMCGGHAQRSSATAAMHSAAVECTSACSRLRKWLRAVSQAKGLFLRTRRELGTASRIRAHSLRTCTKARV